MIREARYGPPKHREKSQNAAFFQPISAPVDAHQGGRTVRAQPEEYRRKAMNREHPTPSPRPQRADLDARYGEIGISAVAAAVRYKGDARNPRYAPVAPNPEAQARIAEQETC